MYFTLLFIACSVVTMTDALSCKGSAMYKLTFKAEWTAQSHPEDFPSGKNPHFSSVVGCTHNASYVMWEPGMNATTGVKDVAERGRNSAINNEIDDQIKLKNALVRFQGSGISNTEKRVINDISVNTQYPLVSAISMIAPSPDWFLGVHDYNLCNQTTGKWIDKRVKDLFLYDSGTDSALRFVHADTPTIPPVPIFLLTNTHEGSLKSNTTTKPFGTFTFEKTSENVPPESSTTVPTIQSTATKLTQSMTTSATASMTTSTTASMATSTTASMATSTTASMATSTTASMTTSATASMATSTTVSMTTSRNGTSKPPTRPTSGTHSFCYKNIYELFILVSTIYYVVYCNM